MKQAIEDFINSKRVAVVGVSRNGKKFGNMIYTELKDRGYQVFPVNPSAQQIDGETCYPDITALKDRIDAVVICVPSTQAEAVMKEAAAVGPRNVWLQQGSETPELVQLGQDLGLNMVSKRCVLMYAPPVRSFHAWHRAFARLFGQL
ncbi:MAG: CoA-binding protein [Anaerolineae bacterium]|nr:CoA-binding protein [Anaerolineae bacterium]